MSKPRMDLRPEREKHANCFLCAEPYVSVMVMAVYGDGGRSLGTYLDDRHEDEVRSLLANPTFASIIGRANRMDDRPDSPTFLLSDGVYYRPRERFEGFCSEACRLVFYAKSRRANRLYDEAWGR